MNATASAMVELRHSPRMVLPLRYTLVRVRPVGRWRSEWTGHVIDISATGMKLGLHRRIEPGTHIHVAALLPGANHLSVSMQGHVVYVDQKHANPLGLIAMGIAFDRFYRDSHHEALLKHLRECGVEIGDVSEPASAL